MPEGAGPSIREAPDVSASAKACFALMLLGHDPNALHAEGTTDLRPGRTGATNSFTRLYLAIFGQVPWERCPAVPPELILLPAWCPLNLYECPLGLAASSFLCPSFGLVGLPARCLKQPAFRIVGRSPSPKSRQGSGGASSQAPTPSKVSGVASILPWRKRH
jgi:hypothetical protein